MLNIRPSTSIERRLIFLETLLNGTDKVSKVSPGSVLYGIAEGISKVSGKAEKDVILAVSQLFPDTAFGSQLDACAEKFGVSPRMAALGSSTYVRLTGDPGTIYLQNTHIPSSVDGFDFQLAQDYTIGSMGFIYALVNSVQTGKATNVAPLTISKISPQPAGHKNIINEYAATGGRDVESDEMFRKRIKDGPNILARDTIAMLEQLFIAINPKVLKIYHQGMNNVGKVILTIATQNGQALTQTELDDILTTSAKYFALTEYRPFGTTFYGIELRNVDYQFIDMSFRVELENSVDPDQVRKDIQIAVSKYVDFRFFDPSVNAIEWVQLYEIVRTTQGVKHLPDQYFYPRTDIGVNTYKLPRMRGFLMLDLDGAVISNYTGTLSPIYYPNEIDASYMATVLNM